MSPDGQLGWLADHTRMSPLLTSVAMAATATDAGSRRCSTNQRPRPSAMAAIPKLVPEVLYLRCVVGMLDVTQAVGRQYVALCLARVFVGFALADKQCRDLLRGQSKLGGSPIDYTDISVKEPQDSSWKTKCRQRIRGCDGVVASLSTKVRHAEGARWEIKCAVEEGIPILGVHIHQDDDYTPAEIHGKKVIRWTWDGIGNCIGRL